MLNRLWKMYIGLTEITDGLISVLSLGSDIRFNFAFKSTAQYEMWRIKNEGS